jgi:hypothetical protein
MNTSVLPPTGGVHPLAQYGGAVQAAQNQPMAATHSLQLESKPVDNDDEDMWDDEAFACIDAAVNRKNQGTVSAQKHSGDMPPAHTHAQPAFNTQVQCPHPGYATSGSFSSAGATNDVASCH